MFIILDKKGGDGKICCGEEMKSGLNWTVKKNIPLSFFKS